MLERLAFSVELADLPQHKSKPPNPLRFHLNNGGFEPGDAECWYQIIRAIKPARVFEIGSGNSTLLAISAISKNHDENPNYNCEHICIEPYENPWLEKTGVSVVRKKLKISSCRSSLSSRKMTFFSLIPHT